MIYLNGAGHTVDESGPNAVTAAQIFANPCHRHVVFVAIRFHPNGRLDSPPRTYNQYRHHPQYLSSLLGTVHEWLCLGSPGTINVLVPPSPISRCLLSRHSRRVPSARAGVALDLNLRFVDVARKEPFVRRVHVPRLSKCNISSPMGPILPTAQSQTAVRLGGPEGGL